MVFISLSFSLFLLLFLHEGKVLIVLPGINVTGGLVGHTIHRGIDCGGGEFEIADDQVSCVPKIDRLEDIL